MQSLTLTHLKPRSATKVYRPVRSGEGEGEEKLTHWESFLVIFIYRPLAPQGLVAELQHNIYPRVTRNQDLPRQNIRFALEGCIDLVRLYNPSPLTPERYVQKQHLQLRAVSTI